MCFRTLCDREQPFQQNPLRLSQMPPLGSSEEAILARVSRMARSPWKGQLIHAIGDDCAVFRPKGSSEDLLFTSDMMIEDVHFRRSTHPATAVGHKALARSLSDIAAMGGDPRFCLLSLALPPWADQRWVHQFYQGLLRLAHRTGAWLAGGDLAHAERFSCDVTVCGAVPKGKALLRSGARPGDNIFVSGALGRSAYGLSKGRGRAWQSHLRPQPQLALGKFIREKLRATAAMDLSDGLSLDLRRLCLASFVCADLHTIAMHSEASEEQALHGGEDYELLFTAPASLRMPRSVAGVSMTRIGNIKKGRAEVRLIEGNKRTMLLPGGWEHFRDSP